MKILRPCLKYFLAILTVIVVGIGSQRVLVAASGSEQSDLLKQLALAKAGIESGLTIVELRNAERDVRAALDLAVAELSEIQKQAASSALHSIEQVLVAWNETLSECHGARSEYVALYALKYGCDNEILERIYNDMGASPEFEKLSSIERLPPKRSEFLQPLLRVTLERIQLAMNSIRGAAANK